MALFSVTFFIFLFLTVLVYYIVPKKMQQAVLLAASYIFYCYGTGWKGIAFILITTVSTFAAALKLEKLQDGYQSEVEAAKAAGNPIPSSEKTKLKATVLSKKRHILAAGLIINFGILAVLKYGRFIIENIDQVMTKAGFGGHLGGSSLILPLGISFYTFMTMGYLIDVHRDKYKPDHNLFHFALFTAYFPQIIQGPIGRYNDMAKQLQESHKWDDIGFRTGFLRLLWGYFKKIVIAERAGLMVNEVFANFDSAGYKGFVIFIAALLYGFQIYADFSGGMDIVFGASDMFGIHLTENFRQPYYAKTVTEFWQRWHITLGAWMKDYVFYPICLSKRAARIQKKLKKRFGNYYGRVLIPTFASFVSFVLVGIWHGADWKYVFYGIFMAAFVSTNTLLEKFYGDMRKKLHVNADTTGYKAFQIIRTTIIVLIGRFLSRGSSTTAALGMVKAMFTSFNINVFTDGTLMNFGLEPKDWLVLLLSIGLLMYVDYINENGVRIRYKIAEMRLPVRWVVYYAAIMAILIIGIYGVGYDASSFIYQNF
ncbi:MAG: MBOAT family protein [Lachnospiraceae bacterium]|nr:MBOAT family protein [Lachnospiraceae bacterium]